MKGVVDMSKTVCGAGKKVLASALSAAMVVAFAPAVAMAGEVPGGGTASNGTGAEVEQPSQSEGAAGQDVKMLHPAENGTITISESGTYKLAEDITADIAIDSNADVTIDLNGKTITVKSDCGISVVGKLTVKDTGSGGAINCENTPVVSDGADAIFTLESGKLKSNKNYCIYCKNSGKAVINGGEAISKLSVLSGNNTTGDMNFEINGGTLTAESGPAIYMSGQVNLKMTGGVLNGGISLRMGQVDISGGTINAMTDESQIDKPSGTVNGNPAYTYSGNVWFPDALYVIGGTYKSNNAKYGNSLKLNITGGTFNCENNLGSAVAVYDLGKIPQDMSVSVSGAAKLSTKAASRSAYQVVGFKEIGVEPAQGYGNADNTGKVSTAISAGTFSSDVSAYMDKGACYEYKMNGGKTFIVQAMDAAAPANSTGFNSWSTADENNVRSEEYIAPAAPVNPTPTPRPEPTPAAPGTAVTGTDNAGNKVDATVTDNTATTLPDGTTAAGSVEYKGSEATGSTAPTTEVSVPSTVTTSDGSTYVVTKIADSAFEGQEQLNKVTIPETVVEIGDKAFAGTSIEEVKIPAATTTIGAGVFKDCESLKTVDISASAITEVPADAFNGTALKAVEIPATVTTIGARAFKGTALKSVSADAAIVAKSAFAGCESLKSASLPKATEIGKYAFNGAAKLKSLATGKKLEVIGYKALAGTKVGTLTVRSKKLTKGSVKGSLKGSNVKKVVVDVTGSKKTAAETVEKYKKFFTKKNCGKSVKVVAKKK